MEKDLTFDQSESGRIIKDESDLFNVVAHAADSMKVFIDLAGEVSSDDDGPRLEAIQLLAKQRYEDLANAMVYVSAKGQS